jgi:hypothetical protein
VPLARRFLVRHKHKNTPRFAVKIAKKNKDSCFAPLEAVHYFLFDKITLGHYTTWALLLWGVRKETTEGNTPQPLSTRRTFDGWAQNLWHHLYLYTAQWLGLDQYELVFFHSTVFLTVDWYCTMCFIFFFSSTCRFTYPLLASSLMACVVSCTNNNDYCYYYYHV